MILKIFGITLGRKDHKIWKMLHSFYGKEENGGEWLKTSSKRKKKKERRKEEKKKFLNDSRNLFFYFYHANANVRSSKSARWENLWMSEPFFNLKCPTVNTKSEEKKKKTFAVGEFQLPFNWTPLPPPDFLLTPPKKKNKKIEFLLKSFVIKTAYFFKLGIIRYEK